MSGLATSTLAWRHHGSSWNTSTLTNGPSATSATWSPGPTSISSAQMIEVVVGGAGNFAFNPELLTAAPGTVLRFNFLGRNCTLIQSFEQPTCLDMSRDAALHHLNPGNVSGKFVVDYKVRTTEPMWFYCAQIDPGKLCEAGTVFSLNTAMSAPGSGEETSSAVQSVLDCGATSIATAPTGMARGTAPSITSHPRQTIASPDLSNSGFIMRSGVSNLVGLVAFAVFWY